VLLMLCVGVGVVAMALQGGPVTFHLLNGSALKLGSDDFVLSNASFQNGTTYYADLKGSGERDILEIHDLRYTHSIEIVLHHATKDQQRESHLVTLPSPFQP